jgi:acylphosphatase
MNQPQYSAVSALEPNASLEIRVRGRVQGVGFRPAVWRFARELALCGDVQNDSEGVLIRVSGARDAIAAFVERLQRDAPPLSGPAWGRFREHLSVGVGARRIPS